MFKVRGSRFKVQSRRTKYFVCGALALGCAIETNIGRAQNAPSGGFEILNKPRLIVRPNGARLEAAGGLPARVRRQGQIDLTAQVIALDYQNQTITQIRAKTGVKLLLNLPGKTAAESVRLEVQSNEVMLDAVVRDGRRTLILNGNVNGFYQVGTGEQAARNTLSGSKAVLTFGAQPSRDLRADIEGGTSGFRLEVSVEALGGDATQDGRIVLTSQRGTIDQSQGNARLIGNARAVSSGGENNFDVSASEFVMKFGVGTQRSLESLETVGRAQIKVSITPPKGANPKPNGALRPTYVEVTADKATVEGKTQTLTLEGNVQGLYRIVAGSTASSNDQSMAGDYKFSGSNAVMRFVPEKEATADVPAGLNLDINSVVMQLPGLDLGFDQ